LFLQVLYKKFEIVSEVLQGLCDVAHKLIVFDVSILVKCSNDEAFIFFNLADMLDYALIEFFVLDILYVTYLYLLYLLVFQVSAA